MIYLISSQDTHYLRIFYGIEDIIEDYISLSILLEKEKGMRIGIKYSQDLVNHLLSINYPLVIIEDDGDHFHPAYRFIQLPLEFFRRDAETVARELLGKIVVVRKGNEIVAGKIVETEAYYGMNDPASRAHRGKKNYNKGMWLPGGHIFIYMVHANWMFNITTDYQEAQAVLIRAVEPLAGLKFMYERRKRKLKELCDGPGKWTRAFGIDKKMNESPLGNSVLVLESPWKNLKMNRSHRMGVSEDVDEPLRFFIPSKFTSNNRVF